MNEIDSINSNIRSFILHKFPAARKRAISDETQLLGSGIVDSLGMLAVVDFLENSFGIKLADDELTPDNFGSISRLTTFVEKKKGQTQVLSG